MIAVVIPLFEQRGTIRAAVASALAQSLPADEVIVVDDGSTDGGTEELAGLGGVRVVRQVNAGVSAARNRGVELTKSPLVAFLDGDDRWEPTHLAALANLATLFPEAVALGTGYTRVDARGHGRTTDWAAAEPFLVKDYFEHLARTGGGLCTSATAVRREAFASTGGFPEGVHAGEDLVAWARLACHGPIAFDPRPSAVYNVRDVGGKMPSRPSEPDLVAALLRGLAECAPASFGSYLGGWHRMRATAYCELGDTRACVRELRLALWHSGVTRRDASVLLALAVPLDLRRRLFSRYRLSRYTRE